MLEEKAILFRNRLITIYPIYTHFVIKHIHKLVSIIILGI